MEEQIRENQRQTFQDRNRENLLKQVAADRISKPKGYYQSIALDILTVASALGTGYSLKIFFEQGTIVPLALNACLFLIFSCFEIFLITDLKRRFFVLILETAALLWFFSGESSTILSVTGLMVVVLLFWGEVRSRSDARNSIEIRFFQIVKPLIRKIVTVLSLFIVMMYFPQWNKGSNLISQNWFGPAIASSVNMAESFYPELNFHSNVRDFSLSLAKYELNRNDVFKTMPSLMQKQTLDQVTGGIMESMKKFSGMNISGKETIRNVLYIFFETTLEKWRQNFGNWFLFAWAAAAFLLIRSFGAIFSWIATFFAFSIYQFLIGLHILRIRDESAMREKVEFS